MRKLFGSIFMAAAVGLTSSWLVGCDSVGNAEEKACSYVTLRINPEIELVLDEEQAVLSVNALNADGEVVLSDLNVVGQSVDEASEDFTERATELGYLDPDSEGATVYVDVENEDDSAAGKIKDVISSKINKFFDNNGIVGKVSAETLEKYSEYVTTWNVSLGNAKIIMRVLDLYPEMTAEEVLDLSVAERLELLHDNAKNNRVNCEFRAEYKEKVELLKVKYANMFTLKEEIDSLEKSLAAEGITSEEITQITAQIEAKEAELKELHAQFKAELDALKTEYKQKSENAYEEIKKVCNERKEQYKDAFKKHLDKFNDEKDSIIEKIKDWRKS